MERDAVRHSAEYTFTQVKPRIIALHDAMLLAIRECFPDEGTRQDAAMGAALDMTITLLIIIALTKRKGLCTQTYGDILRKSINQAIAFGMFGHEDLVESMDFQPNEENPS